MQTAETKDDVNKIASTSEDNFQSLIEDLDILKNHLRLITQRVKGLKKNYHKRKNTNIKSGFVKPVNISKDLASFLNCGEDEKIARSVVNKSINEYIVTNNLQVPEFKQTFVLDEKLAKVFNLELGTVVNYFKMQSYLKQHYPKITV